MQESFPTGTLGPNSAGTLGQWGLHYGFFTIPSRISCPYQPQQHGRKGLRKIFEPLGGWGTGEDLPATMSPSREPRGKNGYRFDWHMQGVEGGTEGTRILTLALNLSFSLPVPDSFFYL